jgi:hypothetical protein
MSVTLDSTPVSYSANVFGISTRGPAILITFTLNFTVGTFRRRICLKGSDIFPAHFFRVICSSASNFNLRNLCT